MKRFSLQRLTPPPLVANRNALIANSEQYLSMQNRFGARFDEGLKADKPSPLVLDKGVSHSPFHGGCHGSNTKGVAHIVGLR